MSGDGGDGVVVVPVGRQEHVLRTAQSIDQTEDAIRELVRQGARLDEARAKAGYHTLQTRKRQ
jgi:regulator of RNase E activity RraA